MRLSSRAGDLVPGRGGFASPLGRLVTPEVEVRSSALPETMSPTVPSRLPTFTSPSMERRRCGRRGSTASLRVPPPADVSVLHFVFGTGYNE
ncbi:hypothetical protein [Polyangium spumosum]|uniref:Uncharacterized protein n=1 Tax=Polyangium spumosum TaxID=889282 RepID=A0A6N7PNC4_9BACT|nr:hypothetical protein [Polyangium spumosum]MRG93419.1 hypothetical protein [Polyangium spumosum]